MRTVPVVVVGAGSSGIVACKVLRERGVPFVCFEAGSGVGGNWRYGNDNGMSSAYRSLHINTNRDAMAYSDFPVPASYPVYPSHAHVLAYFEAYADRSGIRADVEFRTRVESVEPLPGGGFEVAVRRVDVGEVDVVRAQAVVVANGHHWSPLRPSWPGAFRGEVLHSHDYKTPHVLTDRRVVVVGAGNSAADIATEAARHAEATFLSVRRGAHVVPKYVFGVPTDSLLRPSVTRLPFGVQRRAFAALLRVARGRQEDYGFPTPGYPFGSEHPTVSSHLLSDVGHGRITVKPAVERLDGDHVVFSDGSRERADVVVAATGYKVEVPFLPAEVFDPAGNRVRLFRHVAHLEVPGLYFVGLVQPLGATMPLAEAQSEWVADLVTGRAGLPDLEVMSDTVDRTLATMERRYAASPRHTIQVDFYPYLREVARERRRGRRRPKAQAVSMAVGEGAKAVGEGARV